jgi:hypothetical protein
MHAGSIEVSSSFRLFEKQEGRTVASKLSGLLRDNGLNNLFQYRNMDTASLLMHPFLVSMYLLFRALTH